MTSSAAPPLSTPFRSDTRADVLARLLVNPGRSHTPAELSRATGSAYATTHREVRRLVDFGLLTGEKAGRAITRQPGPSSTVPPSC